MRKEMTHLRSENHQVIVNRLSKVALNAFDDKRCLLGDGNQSVAYGHVQLNQFRGMFLPLSKRLSLCCFSLSHHLIKSCFFKEVPSFGNDSGDDDNSTITSNCNVVDKNFTASCSSSNSEYTDDEDSFSSTCTATFSISADDHAPNDG